MQSSWLVQRLQRPLKPTGGPLDKVDEVFAFGCGFKNGGLSDDAMKLLRPLFRFDYMGAAEFEFGAVPKAFQAIAAAQKDLVAFDMLVETDDGKHVNPKWDKPGKLTAIVYVICQAQHKAEVQDRVASWAYSPYGRNNEPRTKERVCLHDSIRSVEPDSVRRPMGWLELDNGYMFFLDKAMFDGVCRIFGLEPQLNERTQASAASAGGSAGEGPQPAQNQAVPAQRGGKPAGGGKTRKRSR